MTDKHETETGSEFISPTHLRHVMRYVQAANAISQQFCEASDVAKHSIRILDAACGTGYGSNVLSSIIKSRRDVTVLGVDFCDEALQYAVENYSNAKTRFEKRNILQTMDPSDEFDVVVSIETIEHFSRSDIDLYLNSLLGTLKQGGLFIVSTPYCEKSGPSPITIQHLYEFNIDELQELLNNRNLEILNLELDSKPGKAGRLGYAMVTCRKRNV